MFKITRQPLYKYVICLDGTEMARIYRGGDGQWRIFATAPLPFPDATVTNAGYPFVESAITEFLRKMSGDDR